MQFGIQFHTISMKNCTGYMSAMFYVQSISSCLLSKNFIQVYAGEICCQKQQRNLIQLFKKLRMTFFFSDKSGEAQVITERQTGEK